MFIAGSGTSACQSAALASLSTGAVQRLRRHALRETEREDNTKEYVFLLTTNNVLSSLVSIYGVSIDFFFYLILGCKYECNGCMGLNEKML